MKILMTIEKAFANQQLIETMYLAGDVFTKVTIGKHEYKDFPNEAPKTLYFIQVSDRAKLFLPRDIQVWVKPIDYRSEINMLSRKIERLEIIGLEIEKLKGES